MITEKHTFYETLLVGVKLSGRAPSARENHEKECLLSEQFQTMYEKLEPLSLPIFWSVVFGTLLTDQPESV